MINKRYKLIHGDSLNPNTYPDKKFDLIVCDPIFKPIHTGGYKQIRNNTQYKMDPLDLANTWNKENYNDTWDRFLQIISPKLKRSGYFVFKSDAYTAREIYHICSRYLKRSYTIIWDKCRIGLGRRWRAQHEILEIYEPKNPKPFWSKKRPKDYKNQHLTFRNLDGEIVKKKTPKRWHGGSKNLAFPSILRVPNYNNGTLGKNQKDKHINRTNPKLWYWFLEYMCPKDGSVLDPFMGSASIAIAIKKLNEKQNRNRSYCGIEINNDYYNLAKSVMENPLNEFMKNKENAEVSIE